MYAQSIRSDIWELLNKGIPLEKRPTVWLLTAYPVCTQEVIAKANSDRLYLLSMDWHQDDDLHFRPEGKLSQVRVSGINIYIDPTNVQSAVDFTGVMPPWSFLTQPLPTFQGSMSIEEWKSYESSIPMPDNFGITQLECMQVC